LGLPWGSTVTYDLEAQPTAYSWEIFFIHIERLSASATVASGHKDATPT